MAYQLFFERCACACLIALIPLAVSSCATVRPEEKELLADPAMTYGSGGELQAQEDHVLTNREGSAGSSSHGTAGGCGCN